MTIRPVARFSLPVYFPFTLPVCDQLVGEIIGFTPEKTKNLHLVEPIAASIPLLPVIAPLPPRELVNPARRISRVAAYIYQKVVRRTPFGVQPSPKNPQYLLFGAKELLECGHEKTIYATPTETFTARVRNCWECSGWFGGLKLDDIKKPVQRAARAAKDKMAGSGYWPLAFASLLILGAMLWFHSHRPISYTYAAPDYYFRILRQIDDYSFVLQRINHGVVEPATVFHFCKDYFSPGFEPGMQLIFFSYEDRGSCVSVGAKEYWYTIDRGPDGWPKLTKNCKPDLVHDHVVCDGIPQF